MKPGAARRMGSRNVRVPGPGRARSPALTLANVDCVRMRPPTGRSIRALAAASVTAALLIGCRADRISPASAELLVVAGDSTYWVRSGSAGLRVRGSPIQLARYDGKFVEIYAADDDRSFEDASIVGQTLFRRDLLTGDSLEVLDDTAIEQYADGYGRSHPDDRELDDDDEGADDPHTTASSDIEILARHGPYLSYGYRADATSDSTEWHAAWRGVLDLRDGTRMTVEALFGDSAGRRVLASGEQLFLHAVDSVRSSRDRRAREVREVLPDFRFDSSSFSVVEDGAYPAVAFAAPGRGVRAGGFLLPLPPIRIATPPSWWTEVQDALPTSSDSAGDRWKHGPVQLLARYGGDGARVGLIDSAGYRWPIAMMPVPVTRVWWLDQPRDSANVRVLSRAFDEAALYSDDARTASLEVKPHRGLPFSLARARGNTPRIHARPRRPLSHSTSVHHA
jgi:hypothetical protein